MPNRIRELIREPLAPEYFQERIAQGWAVVAVEWRTPSVEAKAPASESGLQEPPYGQRVAQDCGHLVQDDSEMDVLLSIYERTISGLRPTEIAAELNKRGYRTRRQQPWTPSAVFDLLPRLIELSPKLQGRPDWPTRRAKLTVTA